MKVGDYVRIDGYISKTEHIKTSSSGKTYVQWKQPNGLLASGNINIIEKTSPNIIDLIKAGDYVNGQKVFDKLYDEKNVCWYLKLEIGEVFGKYARTYEQHIKTIVTKEQFEAVEYKVEV